VVRPETHAVSIVKDTPAAKAGIHRGDEIVQLDDIDLKSAWHARGLLARTRPGETHTIVFLGGGQVHEAKIKLEALPASLASTDLHPEQGWLGIEFESSARVAGVIYREGSSHLALDDDIQKIGRTDFDGVDGLAEWLARDRGAPTAELQVWRRSAGKILVMTLDKLD
jgi:membrane-associated protease RseP (regulator of RpoE activity)